MNARRPQAGARVMSCPPGRLLLATALLGVLAVHGPIGRAQGRVDGRGASEGARYRAAAGNPSVRELVGQRVVVAMQGTSPSPALLARIRHGEVGGIILFGANIEGRAGLVRSVAAMQRAARSGGRPPLLIATDQEGGHVRRLPWVGPSRSTTELGRLGRVGIQAAALEAGKQLRAVGVNVDLAPVADVPVAGSFMALEQRTFATRAGDVAVAASAFARGLAVARVAAAVKHFPGIGRAARNTDRTAVVVPATAASLRRTDLLPFRTAIADGAPIVMISNATYPAFDAKPALWSPRILALLRDELGFKGVTITDALDGAAFTRGRPVGAVASLAAQAGIDLLLLTGSETSSEDAYERVVAVAEQGKTSDVALRASYDRILSLKRVYG